MEKRHIAILGSTGSIGRQALDVISQHRDLFVVELLTANNSTDLLIRQAIEFDANSVVICNEDKYKEVSEALVSHISRTFGIDVNIIFGDIDVIDKAPLGGLVVILDGAADRITAAVDYLKDRNIGIEVLAQ